MIITIVGRHDNNYTKVCVNNSVIIVITIDLSLSS